MEEKASFHYDANITLGHHPEREFSKVLDIFNLQPVAVRWEDATGEVAIKILYLDFYNEVVYENANKRAVGPLAEAVLQILRDKKTAAQKPMLPEGYVESILGNKQQIFEKKPDARKYQT